MILLQHIINPPNLDDIVVAIDVLRVERWRKKNSVMARPKCLHQRGITLKIADGQQKQENQIKAVRSFIAQGVDAIFIAPVVATGWEPVLKEAKDAEIPVFLLDRSIDVKDKSLYMTTVTTQSFLKRSERIPGTAFLKI